MSGEAQSPAASASAAGVGESLKSCAPTTVRYEVVVKEILSGEAHVQEFTEVVKAIPGVPAPNRETDPIPPKQGVMGYRTICKRVEEERVLFKGQFTTRPKISALAKLMEDGA